MLKKVGLGLAVLMSTACADTYTGLDVKNGKGIEGKRLKVEGFVGTLKVENLDVRDIVVKAKGSDDYLRNLVIEQDGSTLIIKHKDSSSPSLKDAKEAGVTIQMPRTFPLEATLTSGDAHIADRGGDTVVDVSGSANAKLAGVDGNFKSLIQGAGDIEVTKLTGDADVTINGSGSLNVNGGKSSKLKASISGVGEINFGGEVKDANLNVNGAGNITVNRLTGSVEQNVSGQGNINIKSKA